MLIMIKAMVGRIMYYNYNKVHNDNDKAVGYFYSDYCDVNF